MIGDIVLIFVALIALVIASICDLRKKEVPDWTSLGLIFSALVIRLFYSLLYGNWPYFYYGLLGFFIMFIVGNVLYYAKQWGGGDAKLVMGLGAAFATQPYFISGETPFLFVLSFNMFLVGAFYGLFWSFYLGIKHFKDFKIEFKRLIFSKGAKGRVIGFFVISIVLLIVGFFMNEIYLRTTIVLLASFGILAPFLFIGIRAVENVCMYRLIKPNQLIEGDWIAKPVYVKKKLIIGPKNLGITKEQINKIVKAKIKRVMIREGIPFVPSFLIAVILTLIFGGFLF